MKIVSRSLAIPRVQVVPIIGRSMLFLPYFRFPGMPPHSQLGKQALGSAYVQRDALSRYDQVHVPSHTLVAAPIAKNLPLTGR